jgi:hypothetical protein
MFWQLALIPALALAFPGTQLVGKLNADRILCPVLAALVNNGNLRPDEEGDVTLENIYSALNTDIWCEAKLADFQATGIADYDLADKLTRTHRNRCLPGSPCSASKAIHGVTNATERWLNIYKMNGMEAQEHAFSTGTRGGATNVPDGEMGFDSCGGVYPCEERFQHFYVSCANKTNNRFYWKDLQCMLCKAWTDGDRGGEWAFNPLQTGMQWQEGAAVNGFLAAFGRLDGGKAPDPYKDIDQMYLTMDDVRGFMMEGRFPSDYNTSANPRRRWGSVTDFYNQGTYSLPCLAGLNKNMTNYNPPWWQNTTSQSSTGESCHRGVGWCTDKNATCIMGGCICGRGANGISMRAVDGKCVEREDKCVYFGEPCERITADNPSAPY